MIDWPEHYKVALKAALDASGEIMRIYETPFDTEIKTDGSPVTTADLASSKLISTALRTTGISIIGEELEKRDYVFRKEWNQVWIVDPLDGTKEFIKRNGEFAVNIALVEDRNPTFGVIAGPVERRMLVGGKDIGCFEFGFDDFDFPERWNRLERPPLNQPIVMAGSRSHHSGAVLQLINQLKEKYEDVRFVKKGSSLKFFDLAFGNADIYPRFAPTMEWDIAAGQAILEALGGSVVHAETNVPLTYNKENLFNPYFIAKTHAFMVDN